jgi:hypothetical protein
LKVVTFIALDERVGLKSSMDIETFGVVSAYEDL